MCTENIMKQYMKKLSVLSRGLHKTTRLETLRVGLNIPCGSVWAM